MDGAAAHKQAFPAAKAEYIISRRLRPLYFASFRKHDPNGSLKGRRTLFASCERWTNYGLSVQVAALGISIRTTT
jgi:hypothetical protein